MLFYIDFIVDGRSRRLAIAHNVFVGRSIEWLRNIYKL